MHRLLRASVWHRRLEPKAHAFRYNVFYVSVQIYPEPENTPRFFSLNRWNLLSVHLKNYDAHRMGGWLPWLREKFGHVNTEIAEHDTVELITLPRIAGYVFNPISFWILRDAHDACKAIACEVNNTFGSNHTYVFAVPHGKTLRPTESFTARKDLYVSPYTPMAGSYRFTFDCASEGFGNTMQYSVDGRTILQTALKGTYLPMTRGRVARYLIRYPFMTAAIMFRIHWQALRLYLKRVPVTLRERPKHTSGKSTPGTFNSPKVP